MTQFSEIQQTILFLGKSMAVLTYAWAYAMGGLTGLKFMRHWVGPGIFCGLCTALLYVSHTLDWRACSLILLFIPPHFGYGADSIWSKIVRRAIYGTLFAVVGFVIAVLYHSSLLGIFQTVLSIASSVYFGVLNPFKNAEDEQGIIGFCSIILIPFML